MTKQTKLAVAMQVAGVTVQPAAPAVTGANGGKPPKKLSMKKLLQGAPKTLSAGQIDAMKPVFTDTATGIKGYYAKWRVVFDAVIWNGIVVPDLDAAAKALNRTMAIAADVAANGGKALTAADEKVTRNRANNCYRQAQIYNNKFYNNALITVKPRGPKGKGKGKGKVKPDAALSVGNNTEGIIEIQAWIADALRIQTATRERLVTFQNDMVKGSATPESMEAIASIALSVGSVQDLLAKLADKMAS